MRATPDHNMVPLLSQALREGESYTRVAACDECDASTLLVAHATRQCGSEEPIALDLDDQK